jgi:hypothetical protein
MRVLVVGQNPGNNPKASTYKNHTFDRLHQWCEELDIDCFSFANCVHSQGAVSLKDVDWNNLKSVTDGHDKILALGSFASKCLRVINKSHFKLPHPSPRNRLMNNKEFVKNSLSECKEYLIRS